MFGIRNPKIESQQSILDYLTSQQLSTANSYALKDTATLTKFCNSNIGTPEIRFYDKNGYLMLYRDNKKCNGQNDSLISFLDLKNVVNVDSSANIKEYISQLKTLDGKDVNPEDFKNYNYYLIMYWAKWCGDANKTKMEDWEKSLNKKNDPHIKTIKVTTDYMNFWKIDENKMMKIYDSETKTTSK